MKSLGTHRLALATFAALVGLGLGGCAASSGPHAEPAATAEQEKIDPWEGGNRKVFAFNEAVDIHALEPVARGWDKIMPAQVQESLTNFYSNLRYPVVFFNDLFQAKPAAAALETGRFLVNTTLGFGGFFDPATTWGLARHEQDFGLTLGHWGVDTGRYLVIPLLGPSTVRDLTGEIIDVPLGVVSIVAAWYITTPLRAVQVINTRAAYLDIVDENRRAAFDYYSFLRDAYLHHRENELTEGGAPARSGNDELYYPDAEKDSP
ncbi:MAG TPA: VacJ family lipoprotein [Myxococcota bacterium]|nr:VacJ family lipoprotein [Myxococcota bacterium]